MPTTKRIPAIWESVLICYKKVDTRKKSSSKAIVVAVTDFIIFEIKKIIE